MKHWLFLPVAIGCFVGSWCFIYAAWTSWEPDLWTERAVVDQGDVFQQQDVRCEFLLVNHFSQSLEIVDVIKGCACSDATFTTKQLQPGEQTSLQVVWKTGRLRGHNGINLNVVSKLADGTVHDKPLRVEANVVPDIVCEPAKLTFDGTNPQTQSVRLTPGRMRQFAVSKAFCNHAAFKADVRGKEIVEITFDAKTPVFANGLEPRLIIVTDSPNEPEMIVPLELSTQPHTQ